MNPKESYNQNNPEKYLGKYEVDSEGYVYLGDIARGLLGMQAQYASRYLDGALPELGYPNFGESLKLKDVFKNGKPSGNYHDYKIHKDDIETFIQRVKKHIG